METLATAIRNASFTIVDHGGQEARTIHDRDLMVAAERHGMETPDAFVECMNLGILPLRYLRNGPSIDLSGQIVLATSTVSVVGCGGLGGQAVLLLARLGLGHIRVFDPDRFDESNLNRQALCHIDNLGAFKAEEAVRQCARINPAVRVTAEILAVRNPGQEHLFASCDVMVDALDNAKDRLGLAALAKDLGIPLVHGAVAGFEGRIMTVLPGDTGMETLYGSGTNSPQTDSAENLLGTPALAPTLFATLQAMAVVNLLLKRGPLVNNRMVHLDLAHLRLNAFSL